MEKNSGLINLCGLWLNKTKAGEVYFSGTLGGSKVMIFKNKYKNQDTQPDYQIVMASRQKQEGTVDEGFEDDGIPF